MVIKNHTKIEKLLNENKEYEKEIKSLIKYLKKK